MRGRKGRKKERKERKVEKEWRRVKGKEQGSKGGWNEGRTEAKKMEGEL